MAYAKVFKITQPGGTGNVTYGGPSATVDIGIEDTDLPMVLFLQTVARTADGGGRTHAVHSFGYGTDRGGTAVQRYWTFSSEDNAGTSDVYAGTGTADMLVLPDGTTGTRDFELALVSMQTGSFTLNWANLHSTASIEVYGWVMTDSLVADALVGQFTIANATTTDVTVAASFGQPDIILFGLSWNGTDASPLPTTEGDTTLGFGVKQGSANGRCIRWGSDDNATTQATFEATFNNRALHLGNNGSTDTAFQVSADSGFPTNGFEITRNNGTAAFPIHYCAIRLQTGMTVTHGEAALPTSNGGTVDLTSADTPTFAFALHTRTLTANTVLSADASAPNTEVASWGIGAADADGTQMWMGASDDDAQGTASVCGTYQNDGAFIEDWQPSSNTRDGQGTISPNGTDWRITMAVGALAAHLIEWLAIGAPGGGGGTSETPTPGVATASGITPAVQVSAASTPGTAPSLGITPTSSASVAPGLATTAGTTPSTTVSATPIPGAAPATGIPPTTTTAAQATPGQAVGTGIVYSATTIASPGIATGTGISPSDGSSSSETPTPGTATGAGITPTSTTALLAGTGSAATSSTTPTASISATPTRGDATGTGTTPASNTTAGTGAAIAVGVTPAATVHATVAPGAAVAVGITPTEFTGTRPWTYQGTPTATYDGTAAMTYGGDDDWTYTPVTG